MKKIRTQMAAIVITLAPLFAYAGGDEVVVVYNKHVPESKAVAEYYAK